LPRVLTPAHQTGHFVSFLQPVHSLTQAELVAVLARAEIAVTAYTHPAERLATKLAGFCTHLRA
jgi:hypothetical protein